MIKNIKLIIFILGTFLLITASSTSKSDYYNEVAKSQKLIMDVYKYTVNNYADKINSKTSSLFGFLEVRLI